MSDYAILVLAARTAEEFPERARRPGLVSGRLPPMVRGLGAGNGGATVTLDSNSYSLLADLGKPQKTTPAPSVTPGGHPAASGSRFRGSSPQESASAELARLVEGVFSEIASQRLTIDGLLAENANLAADNERLRELLDGLRDSYETELANLQSPPESEAG